ncbi:MAG TPA: hypothetical protein VET24_01385 [Actinomycetota bacterium]|nr:hypothetical protein [Actinomycetota bacterium]
MRARFGTTGAAWAARWTGVPLRAGAGGLTGTGTFAAGSLGPGGKEGPADVDGRVVEGVATGAAGLAWGSVGAAAPGFGGSGGLPNKGALGPSSGGLAGTGAAAMSAAGVGTGAGGPGGKEGPADVDGRVVESLATGATGLAWASVGAADPGSGGSGGLPNKGALGPSSGGLAGTGAAAMSAAGAGAGAGPGRAGGSPGPSGATGAGVTIRDAWGEGRGAATAGRTKAGSFTDAARVSTGPGSRTVWTTGSAPAASLGANTRSAGSSGRLGSSSAGPTGGLAVSSTGTVSWAGASIAVGSKAGAASSVGAISPAGIAVGSKTGSASGAGIAGAAGSKAGAAGRGAPTTAACPAPREGNRRTVRHERWAVGAVRSAARCTGRTLVSAARARPRISPDGASADSVCDRGRRNACGGCWTARSWRNVSTPMIVSIGGSTPTLPATPAHSPGAGWGGLIGASVRPSAPRAGGSVPRRGHTMAHLPPSWSRLI